MKLFSEKVKHTLTNSSLNILQVEAFEEIFFGVYEIEINKSKYPVEKISEHDGNPVVSVPVTVEGVKRDYPFVLSQGKFEVLFNENNKLNDDYEIVEDTIVDILLSETVEEVEETINIPEVVDNRGKIIKQIQKAKSDAQLALQLEKAKNLKEIQEETSKKNKLLKNTLDAARENLVEEFVSISKKIKSELVDENDNRFNEIRETIDNKINDLATTLSESLKKDFKQSSKIFDDSIKKLIKESYNSLQPKIDEELRGIATDIVEKVSSIEKNLDKKLNDKVDKAIIENVEGELNAVAKANVELNDKINKGVNKALSRVGNVDTKVNELTIALSEEVENKISKSEENITNYYSEKLRMLEEKTFKVTEETRKYIIDLVTESRNNLISEIRKIKDEKPIEYIVESKGKKQSINSDELIKDFDKKINTKIDNEVTRLRKYISVYSGGGSVAMQFADGGTMNGDLVVNGNVTSNNISGINTGDQDLSGFIPYVGATGNVDLGNYSLSANRIFTTQLDALSANITVIDIKQYELSGFNVVGDVIIDGGLTITGNISASNLSGTNTGDQTSAENLTLSRIGNSTYSTVQHLMNLTSSAGQTSGGVVTDAGSQTVNVGAGTGFIKSVDSDVATLSYFDWPASNGISIPLNTTRYIGVEYNGGSPQVVSKTTNDFDLDTAFPLAEAINQDGTLHILNNPWWVGDAITNIIERFQADGTIYYDKRIGGLNLGVTGTRNITMTAGTLWSRLNEFAIPAINTSTGGTFTSEYRDGSGGWVTLAGLTQFPNTQYDDGSGTLLTMGNNRWGSLWFYVETDGDLVMLYPQVDHPSLAAAETASPPTDIPQRLRETGILIGRMLFQKNASTATVESAFQTSFTPALVTSHNDLGELQGGAIGEYYHLTAAEKTQFESVSGQQIATVVDPVRTTLTGNGILSSFAISGADTLINPSALIVAIDGALQEPTVDYGVGGGIITFTSPLASGAKAVVISPTNVIQMAEMIPADGSVSSTKLANDISISGTLGVTGIATFNSPTRPTSSGTGTPDATSLITSTDADDKGWIYATNRQRIKVLNLSQLTASTSGTNTSVSHMAGSSRIRVGTSSTGFASAYQTGNNNQTMCLAQAGQTTASGGLAVTDWGRPILLSFVGQLGISGANAIISLGAPAQNGDIQMIEGGMGAEFIWNGSSHDVRLVARNLVGGNGSVTGATNASPIVITDGSHGYVTGDLVRIYGVLGNTAANGWFTVGATTTDTFELSGSTGNGAYTSGGTSHRTTTVLTTVSLNTVFYLDIVASSGTAILYLNGTSFGSLSATPLTKTAAYFNIAGYQTGGTTDGSISVDEVRLGIR